MIATADSTTVAYHADGHDAARPAVNVKLGLYDQRPLDELRATLGEAEADALIELAQEIVVNDALNDAAYLARQSGLGEIEQEGRSGGWLVFTDGRDPQDSMTFDERRDWLAAYRKFAAWCDTEVAAIPERATRLAANLAERRVAAPR